jgi:hypothetical protein
LLTGVLTPNFNIVDLVNFFEKNQKLHIQIVAVTLKVMSCGSMSKKKKWKKSENKRFYGQNKLFFENPALQPLGSFCHMVACRSSLENIGKMSLIPVFNKNSPRAHMESELDVHGKLVKYVVHSSKRKNWKKIISFHTSCPNNNRPVFGLKEFYGLIQCGNNQSLLA